MTNWNQIRNATNMSWYIYVHPSSMPDKIEGKRVTFKETMGLQSYVNFKPCKNIKKLYMSLLFSVHKEYLYYYNSIVIATIFTSPNAE